MTAHHVAKRISVMPMQPPSEAWGRGTNGAWTLLQPPVRIPENAVSHPRHIFLSYRSVEVDFALKLAADLKNEGVNLWIDRLDIKPGDDWRKALQTAVNECVAMISVITPEYVTSRYCQRELARADRMGRPIIPVLLRPLPETDWPFEIERQQYIDFSGWRDPQTYSRQLRELVANLEGEFAEQFHAVPDAETQYLTRLIAELEASKGVTEFIQLSAQAEKLLTDELMRPQPRFAEAWAMQGAFAITEAPERRGSGYSTAFDTPLNGISEAVERYPRFVLVGGPGAGKTMTIQHLVLGAAQARLASPASAPLPFLLKLTKWHGEATPEEFIRAHWTLEGDPIEMLARGDIALYLDGLSEMGISSPARAQQLRQWLASQRAPQRVIVTCRASEYNDDLNLNLPTVQAADMDLRRIEQFVRHYLDDDDADRLLLKILPQDAQAGESGHALYQLARNPFMLSVLVLIFMRSPNGELPRNKGTLLKQLAAELWNNENVRQSEEPRPFDALEGALASFAFAMVDEDKPVYVPRAYALKHLGSAALLEMGISGKFLEAENGNVRFSHQLMQDYFAALGLARHGLPTRLSQPSFDAVGQRIPNKWDAVMIALCGIAHDPDMVIRAVSEVDPYLALDCIASGVDVSPMTREQIVTHVLGVLRFKNQAGRVAAATTLAGMGHEAALPVALGAMREGSWEARHYSLSLVRAMSATEIPGLAQALEQSDAQMRDSTSTALRQIGQSALPALFELLRDGKWSLRRGAAWALGEMRDAAAVPALVEALHDEDRVVAAEAATALGWIRDSVAVPWLMDVLRDADHLKVRKAAAGALGWIGAAALPDLTALLNDEDETQRRLVVEALTFMSDPAVVPGLLQATTDTSADVRGAAIEALSNTEDARAVNRLIEMLSDNSWVRSARQRISDIAARVLEKIGTRNALDAVARWRRGETPGDAKGSLPAVVAVTAKPEATPNGARNSASQLKERFRFIKRDSRVAEAADEFRDLTSKDWVARKNAVLALSAVEMPIALPKLVAALKDEDTHVRMAAVQVLSSIKNDGAMEGLLQAIGDLDTLVCDAAADALTAFGKLAIPGLLRALDSDNATMRGAAIEALGKIGDPSVDTPLIACLTDTRRPWLAEQRVCDLAARALLNLNTTDGNAAVETWRKTEVGQEFRDPSRPSARRVTPPSTLPEVSNGSTNGNTTDQRHILDQLLDDLRHEEWGKREDAAKALREYAKTLRGSKNSPEAQRLVKAVEDTDWVVRFAATEALSWIGDPMATTVMSKLLADKYWMVRVAALRGLQELNDKAALPDIINVSKDANSNVREAAAEALGYLGTVETIPVLTGMLQDDERFVRFAAVEALGRIGTDAAVPVLVRALNDMNIRMSAAYALGQIGSPAAVSDLITHLDDTEGPHWEEKRVCDVVADALDQIGTDEAKTAVVQWRESQPQRQ